jgi:hypothetical protein
MIRDLNYYEGYNAFPKAIYVRRELINNHVLREGRRLFEPDSPRASDEEYLKRLHDLLEEIATEQKIALDLSKPVRYGSTHGGYWFMNDDRGQALEWPLKEQSGGLIPDDALSIGNDS